MSADVDNPYSAPAAPVADGAGIALPIEHAGKGRRFLNWLIDSAILYALTIVVLAVPVAFGNERLVDWYDALGLWQRYLVDAVGVVAYYTFLEGLFGLSIGKLMTGTRVVHEDGRAPTMAQALARSLCRYIPFEALSLAFSEDGRARGWHDSIARTYVVRRRRTLSA